MVIGPPLAAGLPTGGVDDVNVTVVIGALLTLVGGAALLVESGHLLYREYHGRTRYHRTRTTGLRRIAIAAIGFGIGVTILLFTSPSSPLP